VRRQSSPRRANRGFALLALFAFLIAGVLYFVVTSLGPDFFEAYRARKTEAALAEARDALLGYALQYRDQQITTGTLDAMYGYLPMPDLGSSQYIAMQSCRTEGCAMTLMNGAFPEKEIAIIGRLPWRTLGIPPLRDGYGECLWYAVSAGHKSLGMDTSVPMNWDKLGQMDIVIADGLSSLKSTISSAHERPIAIIFSPGQILGTQERDDLGTDDVTECGGNYNPASYLDPTVVAALRNFDGSDATAEAEYYDGNVSKDTSAKRLAISTSSRLYLQDPVGKFWANACPAGTNCPLVANDVGLTLTPDLLFGALRKNASFRIDINSLLDRIVGCMRDKIIAGTGPTGYAKIVDDPASCYASSVVPRGYYPNYKEMIFVARGAMSVNGSANCNGVLLFSSQRGTKSPAPTDALESKVQLRTPDQVSSTNPTSNTNWAANYLEGPDNLASFTGGGTTFSGPGLFERVSASTSIIEDETRCTDNHTVPWKITPECQTAEQDIVRCIPNSASFATVNSPNLASLGFAPLATYDPGSRTLTLGAENVTTTAGAPAADLFGCAWTPETNTQGNGFRAYFTFRFNKLGTGVGNTGFTFAAIDAESNVNISLPCGASGSHLGYSGNNGVTPRLASPKIGIEFDQSRNTGFSEGSGNPGRDDPCGASSCGGTAGFNSHAAIAYWGHETANATDGVTLANDDDNVHGFPTSGSESSNLTPPPQNPNNIGATPPGIAFVDMRSKSGEGGNSYLYHVRVEVTPLTAATSLGDARAAAVSNVDLASPGTVLGGVTLSDGDRVLLAAQTALAENGVYAWHGPANPLTRPSDADSGGELTKAAIRISEGISGGSTWRQTRAIGTVDVDAQSWRLYVQDVKTEVWIDHGSGTPLAIAMEDTTRPMAQLVPTASPTLRDTATIYGVVGAPCGPSCPTGQTCGPGNRCFRQPMKSIRLGFTGSQWTQDQQVTISDFFASWLQ
jgi:hypothetical protein